MICRWNKIFPTIQLWKCFPHSLAKLCLSVCRCVCVCVCVASLSFVSRAGISNCIYSTCILCYAVLCYGMLHHGRIYATKSRQIQYKTRRKLNQQKHKTRGEKYINILLHRRVKVVGIRWWGRRWWWQWRWWRWRWQWRWWRWWSNGEQVKVANRKRNKQPKNRSRNRKHSKKKSAKITTNKLFWHSC